MIVDIRVERLQARDGLRTFVESNESVDFKHQSRKDTHAFVQRGLSRGSCPRSDVRPKHRSFCFVALFRAATLILGCVVSSPAVAVDAVQGGSAGDATKSKGSPRAPAGEEVLVFIPDDALRWEITQGRNDGPITAAYMARLGGELNIGPNVVDLSGLEFATNLRYLTINAPRVSDLGPLRGMKSLSWLELLANSVSLSANMPETPATFGITVGRWR